MFEYHGWAVVRDDKHSCNEARLHDIAEELRQVIGEFGDGSGVTDVRMVNGTCMVWFAGWPASWANGIDHLSPVRKNC